MITAKRSRTTSSMKALMLAGAISLAPALISSSMAAETSQATPDAGASLIDAPAMPAVTLSTPAIEAASAFRAYEKQAAMISPAFKTGAGVEQSLAVGSAYEPRQLSRGAIAYAALVALQDPTFVQAVRVYAKDPDQRRDLAARIVSDPRYAIAFTGASSAAGLIVATLASDTGKLQTTGAAVKQSAYSVQHSAWSKSKIIDPAGRLAKTKSLSAAIMASVPEDVTLLRASEGAGMDANAAQVLGVHGQPISGPYEPVVTRGLAVAALAVLGQGGEDNDAAVETVLTEPDNAACLNMSKLNLYQCLAVAGPWYEDVFCLGEHALKETAQCITKETGTPAQIQAAVTPVSSVPGATAPGASAAAAPMAAAMTSTSLASATH